MKILMLVAVTAVIASGCSRVQSEAASAAHAASPTAMEVIQLDPIVVTVSRTTGEALN
jgi:uncharacterized protein YceK